MAPRAEIEWSCRAFINVVDVLAVHAESLTLIGAHAVLLRTMDLDVPQIPTGDGDLGVTPAIKAVWKRGEEHRVSAALDEVVVVSPGPIAV